MRKSTLPKAARHSFRARSKVPDCVTSAAKETTFDPDFSQFLTVSFRPASLTSTRTRFAVSVFANSSAVALAKPDATPVMTATFPASDSAMIFPLRLPAAPLSAGAAHVPARL